VSYRSSWFDEPVSVVDRNTHLTSEAQVVKRQCLSPERQAGVNHYDTAHPHAHLVVRGVDREGREVRLDRG
jgi:hypothetical protein